jgi:hypothetical protein
MTTLSVTVWEQKGSPVPASKPSGSSLHCRASRGWLAHGSHSSHTVPTVGLQSCTLSVDVADVLPDGHEEQLLF